jgi:hypothetical protein
MLAVRMALAAIVNACRSAAMKARGSVPVAFQHGFDRSV